MNHELNYYFIEPPATAFAAKGNLIEVSSGIDREVTYNLLALALLPAVSDALYFVFLIIPEKEAG